jgi:hypothetical protein
MKKYSIAILLISGVLAGGVSYCASSNPDGLNKVAIDLGFAENETDHLNGDSALAGAAAAAAASASATLEVYL